MHLENWEFVVLVLLVLTVTVSQALRIDALRKSARKARELPLTQAAALAKAVDAERARAARIADEQPLYPDTHTGMRQQWVKDRIAARIRAGETEEPA